MPKVSDAIKAGSKSLTRQKELVELQKYTQQQVPSFSPQCFLLEKAGDIQEAIDKEVIVAPKPGNSNNKKQMPVRQLGINLEGKKARSNLKYIQHVTKMQRSNYESYFGYSPHDIAQMAHYMSVEEVLTDKKAKIVKRFPIMNTDRNLKDYAKADDLLLETRAKRQGAGIESLNIDFVGIDSFTKKQVYMTAKFFFQDIKTMLSSPYANLFTLETSRKFKGKKTFRSIDFHIGWKSNNPKIKKQISNLNLTVRTHLVKYSFDVRQDGSIVVDGTYRGYYVEGFSGPQANILEIAKTRYLEIKQRQEEIEATRVAITRRNKKQVNESSSRIFVFKKLKASIAEEKSKRRGGGGVSSVDFARKAIKIITKNIKENARKRIVDSIVIEEKLHKIYLTKKQQQTVNGLESTKRNAEIRKLLGPKYGETYEGQKIDNIINGIFENEAVKVSDLSDPRAIDKFYEALENHVQSLLNGSERNKDISGSNIVGARQTALEEQTRLASLARLKALQIIAQNLRSSSEIFYAKIPRDIVRNFKFGAASASKVNIEAAFNELPSVPNYIKNELVLSQGEFDSESFQVVPFVFFGNLLESILNTPAAYKEDSGDDFIPDTNRTVYDLMREVGSNVKIDLGFLSYNTPFTGTRISNLKLYYLPISLTELNNFFARVVLAKGKTVYSFSEFVNDLLKKFLTGIFSSCSKESNTKGLGAPVIETTIGDRPEGRRKTTQYFIHGGKNTIHDLTRSGITFDTFGKYKNNLRASIPHFFVFGKNTGIERNIKLIDIADDQLKVAQYYSPRSSLVNDINGNEQLKRTGFMPTVFQSEVETIGFPLMNLGQLIYIDLKPTITINKAKSRPFDASGYYGVIKVSHSISRDRFSTNITSILQISDKDKKIVSTGFGDLAGTEGKDAKGKFFKTGAKAYSSAWDSVSEDIEEEASVPEETTPAEEEAYGFDGSKTVYATFGGIVEAGSTPKSLLAIYKSVLPAGFTHGFASKNYKNAKAAADLSPDQKKALTVFEESSSPGEKILVFHGGATVSNYYYGGVTSTGDNALPTVPGGAYLFAQVNDALYVLPEDLDAPEPGKEAELINGQKEFKTLTTLLKTKGFFNVDEVAKDLTLSFREGDTAPLFYFIIKQTSDGKTTSAYTVNIELD